MRSRRVFWITCEIRFHGGKHLKYTRQSEVAGFTNDYFPSCVACSRKYFDFWSFWFLRITVGVHEVFLDQSRLFSSNR
ncbi:hypothetical protein AYI68_g5013 [Smittium mucronatum]|uniref:Uncharacterized protein n=1 Tax=Smittium mucronatum TaxID=133383 RepID=A0A1R0GVJ1_9FUNG|nr:hypothetical protein AYI68_g5013 [Smittium mucronatum]